MNNLYTQVYLAGRAIGADGTWGVVQDPCVGFRSDNDQFKRKVGWLERLKIDARAYDELAELLFSDRPEVRKAMRRRVFDTHILARVINAKTDGATAAEAMGAMPYLVGRYGGMRNLWLRALPVLIAPASAVRNARSAYQRLAKSSGTARARQLELSNRG